MIHLALFFASLVSILQQLETDQINGKVVSENGIHQVIEDPGTPHYFPPVLQTTSKITYEFSGGRLGDNLLTYFHGKWASMKTGIPLLFRPFLNCNLFVMFDLEKNAFKVKDRKRRVVNLSDIDPQMTKTLFMISYFPECPQEYEAYKQNYPTYFKVDWNDPTFKEVVKHYLAPRVPINPLPIPEGHYFVAVHVRRGGHWESYSDGARVYPLKFPPDEFFIEQLKVVGDFFTDKPLYVYLFTDDLNPYQMLNTYKNALKGYNMVFDCNKLNGELDDFYAISKCDCLIRGSSNFSIIAGYYGDPILTIECTKSHHEGQKVIIDQVETTFKFGR